MTDNITIIQDISLLYELSLSVGTSLDARENCYHFLRTLIRRKGLNFASVWLHRAGETTEPYCDLFCIYPHFREDHTTVACSQYVVTAIQSSRHLTIAHTDPHFEDVMHEKKVAEGSYAVFSLGELGFLKLFASNRPNGFEEIELAQLQQVVDKFKISLDGCFAHAKIKEETESRIIAQKAIQESEEKYRGIIENMELGLLEVDLDETIVHPYPAFCEMLGFKPEELIGKKTLDAILPKEYHQFILNMDSKRRQGQSSVYEIQLVKKDGSPMWALVSGAPIRNSAGEVVGSIGIHYDLSARKKLEHELDAAKRTADQARLAERQFLANMSHEIRTPMNAVIGMTHLLYETGPSPLQIEYLDSLRFSADSLMGLIDSILDLSKIEAGELELEERPFDLQDLLKSLQRAFQYRVRDKAISIDIDIDTSICHLLRGDPTRLSQILSNLLGNATKFTEQGTISVKTRLLEQSNDRCLIEFQVQDTGIGIPLDKQQDIFGYFKQADAGITRRFGGSGLGLTIVKQLVELQGGSIRVESEPGQGARFVFTLPFRLAEEVVTEQEIRRELGRSPNRDVLKMLEILSVEDNAMNQKLLSRILDNWGSHYHLASTGAEAIQIAAEKRFDVILMDIHMPQMDGCEATRAIRSLPESLNTRTPIIALTAAALLEEKKRAMEAGMSDFLTKPFSPVMLEECILRVLNIPPPVNHLLASVSPASEKDRVEINLQYLRELSNGDNFFLQDMVDIYLAETPVTFEELYAALAEENWALVCRIVHKLKPNFGILGMKAQEEKAFAIERSIKSGKIDADEITATIHWLASCAQESFLLLRGKEHPATPGGASTPIFPK